eukprot:SM000222S06966  [mRNA]  locus=s222:39028:49965:- [translate_table: standard]
MGVDAEELSTIGGIATVSLLHSFIPTHWLPYSVVGRAQKWSISQTLLVTSVGAVCHVLSTSLLGLTAVTMAHTLAGEEAVHHIASLLLVFLGAGYIGLYLMGQRGGHGHAHNHSMEKAAVAGLILVPALSPCATTLPVFLAVGNSSHGSMLVAILVLLICTLTVMVSLVSLSFYGAGQVKFQWVERHDKLLVGSVLCAVGILTHVFHHHNHGDAATPLPAVTRDTPLSRLPPLLLPPPLPAETREELLRRLEKEHLTPALDAGPLDDDDGFASAWVEDDWLFGGLEVAEPMLPWASLEPQWVPPWQRIRKDSDGSYEPWTPTSHEVALAAPGERSNHSSSLSRRPALAGEFVRGATGGRPFLPGGITSFAAKKAPEEARSGAWLLEVLRGDALCTVPPGFQEGVDFSAAAGETAGDISGGVNGRAGTAAQGGTLRFNDLLQKEWSCEAYDYDSEEVGGGQVDGMPSADSKSSVEHEDTAGQAQALELPAENQPGHHTEAPASGTGTSQLSEKDEQAALLEELLAPTQQEAWWLSSKKGGTERKPRALPAAQAQQSWAVMEGVEGIPERFDELVPEMVMSFPFALDKFQQEAVYHLEQGNSVFVAAHTSAGKTAVAEYAFALAGKHCTRAIYTSPIKTISNQKFRDFSDRGFDVGLLTGDVSIKPDALCLIMTTEILRSMLYRGADIIRDIEWVIFDEVHYVNDVERGVVWEEVIIMLPSHVGMVLLSATVPNAYEFADWIGRTKRRRIYVTGTLKRPVPLEHYLYYGGELLKIYADGVFLQQGVKQAKALHKSKTAVKPAAPGHAQGGARGAARGRGGGRPGGREGGAKAGAPGRGITGASAGGGGWRSEIPQWYAFINLLSKTGLLPVVIFCFSKSKVDSSADSLGGLDLTSGLEKSAIVRFTSKAFERLKGSDRRLPQVLRVSELLRRGIGCHHAGLLPIVKEVVEMLFCKGVIKVLFSTETFAMGVNAPARSAAFHGLRKHDGQSFRQLHSGEYTQMAGRAGRRGIDKVGTVILMCWDDIPDESDLRKLLTGKPELLESRFRLTYNMILNLLRVEDLKVEDLLKRSFAEINAQRALPEQQILLLKAEGALKKLNTDVECILGDPTITEYYSLAKEARELETVVQSAVLSLRTAAQALAPGRAVVVRTPEVAIPALGLVLRGGGTEEAAGGRGQIVLALHRGPIPNDTLPGVASLSLAEDRPAQAFSSQSGQVVSKKDRDIIDDYSLAKRPSSKGSTDVNIRLPLYGEVSGSGYVVFKIEAGSIVSICREKVKIDAKGILEQANIAAVSAAVQELQRLELQYPSQDPPSLDPIKELKLNDVDAVEAYQKHANIVRQLAGNKCHRCPKLEEHYKVLKDHDALQTRVQELRFQLSDAALLQMTDFQCRVDVLQHLNYVDDERVVQLKGRIACEINSGDELVTSELILANELETLTLEEAVAVLSALVFQQKDASDPTLTPTLAAACNRVYKIALSLGELQRHYGLPVAPEEYAAGALRFGLVEVVYEWAKGTPFADICELTNVPEGTIVRAILRLDETCREVRNVARILGNAALVQKMEAASQAIKRDIVYAASLYVTRSTPT